MKSAFKIIACGLLLNTTASLQAEDSVVYETTGNDNDHPFATLYKTPNQTETGKSAFSGQHLKEIKRKTERLENSKVK